MAGVAILIPAAGASRRMNGRDKLLEFVDGIPLLVRQAGVALATRAVVIVTLPAHPADRQIALRCAGIADRVRVITVSDAAEGMAASLRAGVAACPADATGIMILLPDMPEIEIADLNLMLDRFAAAPGAPILRATTEDGTAGHPVILPARHFAAIAGLSGDTGARDLLRRDAQRTVGVALPGRRATTDLDTPRDWASWRALTGR